MAVLDAHLDEQRRPFAQELALLRTIPRLQRRAGECVLVEIGTTVAPFGMMKSSEGFANVVFMCTS